MSYWRDLDDTARLVLMDDCGTLSDFVLRVREVHPHVFTDNLVDLWRKYRGLDGRCRPTHDVETGAPIRFYA